MQGESTRDGMTLLVIEHGAEWPAWAGLMRELAPNCAVEAQLPREEFSAFAERVLSRLERLRHQGVTLRGAGYACALRHDAELGELRFRVCSSLLERFSGDGSEGERLIIGGGDWQHDAAALEARAELLSLWSDLSERAPGRRISLRFDDSPAVQGPSVADTAAASLAAASLADTPVVSASLTGPSLVRGFYPVSEAAGSGAPRLGAGMDVVSGHSGSAGGRRFTAVE